MAVRKTKELPNFVVAGYDGYARTHAGTEANAIKQAGELLREYQGRVPVMGVYKLVKRVQIKPAPVEVEAVSL